MIDLEQSFRTMLIKLIERGSDVTETESDDVTFEVSKS